MNNNTNKSANNNDEASKGIKVLHSLVESREIDGVVKRLAEIRKRVEKLYTAERARLNELTAERARREREEKQRLEDEAKAAGTAAPSTVSEPEPELDVPVGEPTEEVAEVTEPDRELRGPAENVENTDVPEKTEQSSASEKSQSQQTTSSPKVAPVESSEIGRAHV